MQHTISLIPAPAQKTCNKCGESKSLEDFQTNKTYSLGRDHTCRTCRNAEKRNRYNTDVDRKTPDNKTCSKCKQLLCVEWFSRSDSSDGLRSECKQCRGLAIKSRKYNITIDEYYQMMYTQGWQCALCGVLALSITSLHIDHDHSCCPERASSCGECIRGALCGDCNTLTVAGYERMPKDKQNWTEMNRYLARRPIQAIRARHS